MCPYNQNIPQPNDQLDESQPEFLANFMALQTMIGVDHYTFNTGNDGKHKQLTFPDGYLPLPIAVTESLMQSVLSQYTNAPELVYKTGGVPGNSFITQRQTPIQRFPGWATIGGSSLIMKWGFVTTSGFSIIAFPDDNGASIPRFVNAPYSMILSPLSPPGASDDVWISSVAANQLTFSCYASARTTVGQNPQVTFLYLAIGN